MAVMSDQHDGCSLEEVLLSDGKSTIKVKADQVLADILRSDPSKASSYFKQLKDLSMTQDCNLDVLGDDNTNAIAGPSTAEEKDQNSVEGQRWTKASVLLLIQLRHELDEEFQKPKCKKNKLWESISEELRNAGYIVSGPICNKKYSNLQVTYRRIKAEQNKPNGKNKRDRQSWEFFDILDSMMQKYTTIESASDMLFSSLDTTTGIQDLGCRLPTLESDDDDGKEKRTIKNKSPTGVPGKEKEFNEWLQEYITVKHNHSEEREAKRDVYRKRKLEGLNRLIYGMDKLVKHTVTPSNVASSTDTFPSFDSTSDIIYDFSSKPTLEKYQAMTSGNDKELNDFLQQYVATKHKQSEEKEAKKEEYRKRKLDGLSKLVDVLDKLVKQDSSSS